MWGKVRYAFLLELKAATSGKGIFIAMSIKLIVAN